MNVQVYIEEFRCWTFGVETGISWGKIAFFARYVGLNGRKGLGGA